MTIKKDLENELTFEEALKSLEEIVDELNNGDLELSFSIMFEPEVLEHCEAWAKLRITADARAGA